MRGMSLHGRPLLICVGVWMEAGVERKKPWWRRYEFKFNIAMAVVSLILFIAGILTNTAVLAGPGLILLIFFCTYAVYAHARRNL